MGPYFINDAGFCGGRKTTNRRHRLLLLLGKLPDETGGVQVVRPEVMPPFGKAVCFIKYPATDFALLENISYTEAAQLFGRNVQNRRVPQADSLEDLDDVQKVYANFDMSDEEMAKAEA